MIAAVDADSKGMSACGGSVVGSESAEKAHMVQKQAHGRLIAYFSGASAIGNQADENFTRALELLLPRPFGSEVASNRLRTPETWSTSYVHT